MALVAGSVTVDDEGEASFIPDNGPNLARELFEARLAVENLPDPEHKPGAEVTTTALVGATLIEVDDTEGFKMGATLSVGGPHTVKILSKSADAVTVFPPIVAIIPAGEKVGFKGTDEEWEEQTLPIVIKIKKQLASRATADALAFVSHFTANTTPTITVEQDQFGAGVPADEVVLEGTLT